MTDATDPAVVGDLAAHAQADIDELEYWINNPSAWDQFDDGVSEKLRKVVTRARAALAKYATQQPPVSTETKGEGDWIEWAGETDAPKRPACRAVIKRKYRDGMVGGSGSNTDLGGGGWMWPAGSTCPSDIIAYRVVTSIEGEGR